MRLKIQLPPPPPPVQACDTSHGVHGALPVSDFSILSSRHFQHKKLWPRVWALMPSGRVVGDSPAVKRECRPAGRGWVAGAYESLQDVGWLGGAYESLRDVGWLGGAYGPPSRKTVRLCVRMWCSRTRARCCRVCRACCRPCRPPWLSQNTGSVCSDLSSIFCRHPDSRTFMTDSGNLEEGPPAPERKGQKPA